MKNRLNHVIPVAMLAGALFVTMGQLVFGDNAGRELIRVRGAEGAAAMVDSYAREYMKSHPNCTVVVSGGHKPDWQSFLSGDTEIFMSSSRINDEERLAAKKKGIQLQETMVGRGAIAIVVHPSNPLNELTIDQIRNIFIGKHNNWNQLGVNANEPISVYVLEEKRSDAVGYFIQEVIKAPFGPYVIPKVYFSLIMNTVSEEPNSIGFVRFRDTRPAQGSNRELRAKEIAVKKDDRSVPVFPSKEAIRNGTYPLSRPYYLYSDSQNARRPVKDFFDFCRGNNPLGD